MANECGLTEVYSSDLATHRTTILRFADRQCTLLGMIVKTPKHPEFDVLVLGGYGLFGSRISQRLATQAGWRVRVAGRDLAQATQFCARLRAAGALAKVEPLRLDIASERFRGALSDLRPDLVIHTCGPFQGQDYAVAEAALAAGAHYLDLADARDFVCGFSALDPTARACDRLAVSGASTVPGLSAAVYFAYRDEFSQLQHYSCGVSPGNHTPRGLATVAAILGYVGRPFRWLERGAWRSIHGWQSLRRWHYPSPVGTRWLAACEVPDLSLLPELDPQLQSVTFRAGLELSYLHLGLWLLTWLRRAGMVRDWSRHAPLLKRISEWFARRGSDAGAMHVQLSGLDKTGAPLRIVWQIIATAGDGPQIPATAAVLLAKKLAGRELAQRGAQPCIGLFTLEEFVAELAAFSVHTRLLKNSPPARL